MRAFDQSSRGLDVVIQARPADECRYIDEDGACVRACNRAEMLLLCFAGTTFLTRGVMVHFIITYGLWDGDERLINTCRICVSDSAAYDMTWRQAWDCDASTATC